MSKIDYQKLREIAEKTKIAGEAPVMPFDQRINALNDFMKHFSPDIALALLDERERNQQYIKSRDQENEEIALTVGKLRVELEETKSKLNEQREYYEGVISDGSKRIAELEAEPVSQTCKLNKLSGNSPVTPDGWINCSDRMPEKGQNVLISVNFDSSLVEPLICSARYTGSTFRRGEATIKPGNGIEQATHWMPLPEPPQEVNRG
ncbi:ead/Ea22-like family protein [Escherichia coli]